MKLFWYRLRVSLWGKFYGGCWVFDTMCLAEWQELMEYEPDPRQAYIEGWCAE